MFTAISFYRYVPIEYPEGLRDYFRILCDDLQILGRILIAKEGINAAVSGTKENIDQFKQAILQNALFQGLSFREQAVDRCSYHKLVVRVRKEIVAFGETVDLRRKGNYLSPQEFQRTYDAHEDFVVVDARNDYEYDVGHFQGAVKMPIGNFREFPSVAASQLAEHRQKKIVLYCTGGIRCEKASAYLKEQGFSDVHHLEGGIINYLDQFQDHWEGGLFVFDDRLVEEGKERLNRCCFCGKGTDRYTNCHNLDCDRLFIACAGCLEERKSTCSEECRGSPRQRKKVYRAVKKEAIGKVANYYPKAGVALVVFDKVVEKGQTISFEGKTTRCSQIIDELRGEDDAFVLAGKGELTLPVREKVRKNDGVFFNDRN